MAIVNHTLKLPLSRKSKRVPDWPGPEKRLYKGKVLLTVILGFKETPSVLVHAGA